jgi:hypothetical protein
VPFHVYSFNINIHLCTSQTICRVDGDSKYFMQCVSFEEGTEYLNIIHMRFEIFTAVTMKNVVFWDVAPCRACVNRRFGGRSSETSVYARSTRPHIPKDDILHYL